LRLIARGSERSACVSLDLGHDVTKAQKMKTKFLGFAGAVLLMFILSGCTTFSRSDCETMDYAERGRNGALKGETLSETSYYYLRNCESEHHVPVDREKLKRGYTDGLKTFCTAAYTQRFAANGGVYNGTCPKSEEPKFIDAFRSGRISYLESEVDRLKKEVDRLSSDVSSLESDKSDLQSRVSTLEGRTCN
jgi:hypothetical protein